jgi:hypothetical protein
LRGTHGHPYCLSGAGCLDARATGTVLLGIERQHELLGARDGAGLVAHEGRDGHRLGVGDRADGVACHLLQHVVQRLVGVQQGMYRRDGRRHGVQPGQQIRILTAQRPSLLARVSTHDNWG